MQKPYLSKSEIKGTLLISLVYAFRMFGLFVILPILSLYAQKLEGSTPVLIGIALGIYGLTQAILQIPFGLWSDRIGRKPVIVLGLILFLIGSLIAARSNNIMGIIAGRALQGAGAIGSTLTALLADITSSEHRLKAMSVIGMVIGSTFMLAMVVSPLLNHWLGLSGIFWLTALLAGLAIPIVVFVIPTPIKSFPHPESEPILGLLKKTFLSIRLLKLNVGIFSLHATLTALFLILPLKLNQLPNLPTEKQWLLYLPIMCMAFISMVPLIILAETKNKMRPIFIMSIITLTSSIVFLALSPNSIPDLFILLWIFFTCFTFLEASLPSLISKRADPRTKGTAMGIYSSSQFLGIFFGGSLGGLIYHHAGFNGIFIFCILIGCTWSYLAWKDQY